MYIYDLFSAQELIPTAPAPQKVRIYNVLVRVVGQIWFQFSFDLTYKIIVVWFSIPLPPGTRR